MTTAAPVFTTSAKAAIYYCVTAQTVRRWAKAGKLPAFKTPGGQYRYALIGQPAPSIPKPVGKPTLAAAERIAASVEKAVAPKQEPAPILDYIAAAPVKLSPAALARSIDALAAGT